MLVAEAPILYCPDCAKGRAVRVGLELGSDRVQITCSSCCLVIESGVLVTPGCVFVHPDCTYCTRRGYHLTGCPALTPAPPKTTFPPGTIQL